MPVKSLFLAIVVASIAGACFGVTITAKHYRAEIAQIQTDAIKADQEATAKQLNIEHYWQEQQRQADAEANNELQKIQDKYDKALSMLNARKSDSVHVNSDSTSETALSSDSKTLNSVSACNCQCSDRDRAKLQRLYQRQLTIARDCDITATYYNHLIDWYNSISKETNK
ncbi:MAG: hypothetical protein MR514_02020 [Succinivibrio sp.]|nr:hypothetical protein [Succinivibrio sp.]MDY5324001.1 hypothetical protein [Succinivibrio sp.]